MNHKKKTKKKKHLCPNVETVRIILASLRDVGEQYIQYKAVLSLQERQHVSVEVTILFCSQPES